MTDSLPRTHAAELADVTMAELKGDDIVCESKYATITISRYDVDDPDEGDSAYEGDSAVEDNSDVEWLISFNIRWCGCSTRFTMDYPYTSTLEAWTRVASGDPGAAVGHTNFDNGMLSVNLRENCYQFDAGTNCRDTTNISMETSIPMSWIQAPLAAAINAAAQRGYAFGRDMHDT